MELDLSNKTLSIWLDSGKITIDSKIGDFEFSPIVIFGNYNGPVQITAV